MSLKIRMNKLETTIRDYFEDRKEVTAVYLFGSYATGKEHDFSDIDIGIVLDENALESCAERRENYLVGLGRILRKDIDPVILNKANLTLLRQIFLTGKCILVNNSKKLALYKTEMFVSIAEFSYYRSQMQAGLIRKIMKG